MLLILFEVQKKKSFLLLSVGYRNLAEKKESGTLLPTDDLCVAKPDKV